MTWLLCYLTGVSRFVGLLEVTKPIYEDTAPVWSEEAFPIRVGVEKIIELTPEAGVPIKDLLNDLSIYPGNSPGSWQGHVQGSPRRWAESDGEVIVKAMEDAQANPVLRPFDAKLLRKKARKGKHQAVVTIPAPAEQSGEVVPLPVPTPAPLPEDATGEPPATPKEVRAHTEIEALLLRLGSEMGLDLWIDPHDRSEVVDGKPLGDFVGVVEELAPQFTSDLARAVKRIDVLWLRDEAVIAAFEVESTTAVYSGLLRMADLLALQPNLSIPLFIVASEARRGDVKREITRPTFSKALKHPLAKSCRYISFEKLRERVNGVLEMGLAKALGNAPEGFLATIAESFE